MSAFEVQVVDVGSQRLGDPQTVERQQRGQGMIPGRGDASLDQEGAELVSVQSERARLSRPWVGGR